MPGREAFGDTLYLWSVITGNRHVPIKIYYTIMILKSIILHTYLISLYLIERFNEINLMIVKYD